MTTTTSSTPDTTTAPAAAPGPRARSVPSWVPPLLVAAALIGLWYALSYVLLSESSRFLMPPPHEVLSMFADPDVRTDLLTALGRTTIVSFAGLGIAIVLGVLWGVVMAQAPWVERSLYPYAVLLQTIPILALVPLIGFWFGFELSSRVIVCVLMALFPIVSNTLFGLQSADKGQRELFALQGAGRWTVLTKLQFPAAMPNIFVGLRTSAGLSVIGAIVGDMYFRRGTPGIGALMSNYQSRLQSAELFAAILLSAVLGIVIFWAFGWLARRIAGRWYDFGPA